VLVIERVLVDVKLELRDVVVLVEDMVVMDVDVYIVSVDVVVSGPVVIVIVVVYMVVGAGVVTAAGPTLPVAGLLNHENRTIPDVINKRNVSVTARELTFKKSIS